MRARPGFAGKGRPVARVVLVGMMGSGKTTIGRLLVERTGWPYLDNDELLARRSGMTARETPNASDNIYQSGGSQLLLSLTPQGGDYATVFENRRAGRLGPDSSRLMKRRGRSS